MSTSTGYSVSPTTTPFGVTRSMPMPSVSTSFTLSRLNAGRYSSWKHGRLQLILYQGSSFCAVSGSFTVSRMRWRTFSIWRSSHSSSIRASSSLRAGIFGSMWNISVQPSWIRSTSGCMPMVPSMKFSMRRSCQPGSAVISAHSSGVVGRWLRGLTVDGVRWKTMSSLQASASFGTACTAVAPVPMMPTTLSASLSIGASGPPPVTS